MLAATGGKLNLAPPLLGIPATLGKFGVPAPLEIRAIEARLGLAMPTGILIGADTLEVVTCMKELFAGTSCSTEETRVVGRVANKDCDEIGMFACLLTKAKGCAVEEDTVVVLVWIELEALA